MIRNYTTRLWLVGLLLVSSVAGAASDDAFLAAREAFRVGEANKLERLADELKGSDFEPWARYWLLRLHLNNDDGSGIQAFLKDQAGTYLAEKLRGDWLRSLGKRGDWRTFQSEYPQLVQPDQELVCLDWQGRLRTQRDASVLEEARPVWFSAAELPDACAPVIERLVKEKHFDAEDVWQRVRRLLEKKNVREALHAAGYLPDAEIPKLKVLEAIAANPLRYLERKLPKHYAATRTGREMALFAVQQAARRDPQEAVSRWRAIAGNFSAAERAYAWGQLALQAAKRHMPEAQEWFTQSAGISLSEEQLAWRVRAALRAGDWGAVAQGVQRMPPPLAERPEWRYWLGRALAAQGRKEEARPLFERIGGQPNFYGNLADDELGRPVVVPPRATASTTPELAQVAANPGLRRALALFRLDMRVEATREWNWSLRGMDDRALLAAAELARRNDVYDRAIFTAERTLVEHDFSMRYPAPYRDQVAPKAQALDLDDGWVYGLMRQESRFITSARSGVGAKGLMQVMPNTAKWVARKIGLTDYHPSKMAEMDTNVTLGTHYLKMVFNSLDNHPVLACAAYNAGPGRARRWQASRPLEGAIYVETIPFDETRDYVKKVMTNSVYYALLFDEKPRSLKSRLGIIPAAGGAASPAQEELP